MAFLTVGEAINASRGRWATRVAAASEMQKAAKAPLSASYDIFLSHAYEDAEIIAGVKILLEREGLSVYVDWIEDAQADRRKVTPATAEMLRQRMGRCRFLLFASTKASPSSKWMPWELGYFDGRSPGKVGILPLVQVPGSSFVGQEYLCLYPTYQMHQWIRHGPRLGVLTHPSVGDLLTDAVKRSSRSA